MELSVIGSDEFAAGWKGRPVLVIQGERDGNVSPASVTAAVQQMATDGVAVSEHRDPEAGHFLFFAKLEVVTEVVAAWAERVLPPAGYSSR